MLSSAINSLNDLDSSKLFSHLLHNIDLEYSVKDESTPPFHEWVKDIILDGRPFTYDRHEYLIEPYQDNHPDQSEIKGTQLGLTSKAMLRAMYGARYGDYRGILYLFPSKSDVTDFSKGRIDPLIDDNPDTIGTWVRDTDAANIKRIWNTFFYLRGMKSRVGLKCHDKETEILTKDGWKYFRDITPADCFATRSPSGLFMWQNAIDIYQYNHKGKMLHFSSNGLDMCVTPNHRLLLTKHDNENEWFETAVEASKKCDNRQAVVRTSTGWKGEVPEFIKKEGVWYSMAIPGNYKNNRWKHCGRHPDRIVSLRDWVAFLGLYVSEGSCAGVNSGVRKGGRVSISQQSYSKHISIIKDLMDRLPFNWNYNGKNFRVGDVELAKIVFPMGNKYQKSLPKWVLDLPIRFLEVLWKFAVIGDGSIGTRGHTTYASVNKVLVGQLQEILQKCGRSGSVLIQKNNSKNSKIRGRRIKSKAPCYLVSERRSRCSTLPVPIEIDYNDKVYCVSVPNSTIYTRRNGYAVWSGNSVPADYIVYDELDEAPQNAVDMAYERMGHSEFKEQLKLSNPTLPDYGIDKAFKETDQRFWLIKCPKCNTYTCLVTEFMENKRAQEVIIRSSKTGEVIRACKKCHSELNPSNGVWVAKKPGVTDKRGRQYSQLWSHFVPPEEILHKFLTTDNLTDFYNLKIGVAYVEAENQLSVSEVLALCSDYGIQSEDPGPCSMGVDQGKDLHVVIGRRWNDLDGKIVHLGVYKDWEDLERLMVNFNISRCVVDALPETRNARTFAKKFKGQVFLNYYNIHQKGSYAWDEKDFIVSCNRTESLDASHNQIMHSKIILPRSCDIVKTFAKQLHNVAKKLIEEETTDNSGLKHKTGGKRYVYVKLSDDHFRHAFNYETMARQFGSESLFSNCMH